LRHRPARIRTAATAGIAVAVALLSFAPGVASAGLAGPDNGALTLAVFGDAPYGTSPTDTAQFDATPRFVDSVNADPDVSGIVHVGDIHSGKQFCTQPYDRSVLDLWTRFLDPLVYTPGDNEWADCHKQAEGGGTYNPATGQIDYATDAEGQPIDYAVGNPDANLALVRSMFFAQPGRTLGRHSMPVLSQATVHDAAHPSDPKYVENVLWERRGIVFVTLNIPGGSNNDADVWYGAPTASAEQAQEQHDRTGADLRWLDRAFATAQADEARSVVVIEQADMWDLDGKAVSHLTNYDPFVQSLADHAAAFGRPVLLFNGDSHAFRSDNPLQATAPCFAENTTPATCSDWANHTAADGQGFDVPNFHRVTVHGSTSPMEWLKLTISSDGHLPSSADGFGPFSWQRMAQ
jgi:hypothetical protein